MSDWFYQTTDSDCGLCALCNGLMYKGISLDYETAFDLLRARGLKTREYKGLFFHLPLILADLDIPSTVYLPSNDPLILSLMKKNHPNNGKLKHCANIAFKRKHGMYFFYKSFLQIAKEKNKIRLISHPIHIAQELKSNKVVLANLVSEDFYQVADDDANHILTLIPDKDSFQVIDPYKLRGYQEFDNWEECLQMSQKYDWSGFDNFAVSF